MTNAPSPDDRIAYLLGAYEQVDKRIGFLQSSLDALRQEMENRFDRMERKFETVGNKIEGRLERLEGRFDPLQASINSSLRWSVGAILGVGAAVFAAVLAVR